MNTATPTLEPTLFVPFRMEPETILRLHERSANHLKRFVHRWACLGVLVVDSIPEFSRSLSRLLRNQEVKSTLLRSIPSSIGTTLPAQSTAAGFGEVQLVLVDENNWEQSPLGCVFTARVFSRGDELRALLEPAFKTFNTFLVVDGYLASDDQATSLLALGRMLAGKKRPLLECWSVSRPHANDEDVDRRCVSQEQRQVTWDHIAQALLAGGAPRQTALATYACRPFAFSSRTHDRLLVMGPRSIIGSGKVGNRFQRVVALGPGIRGLSDGERQDKRLDVAARVDASCFARLRTHFEPILNKEVRLGPRPLSAL